MSIFTFIIVSYNLICYCCFLTEHDQITTTDIPLSIQQKISPSECSSGDATLLDKDHATRTSLQLPSTETLYKKLPSSLSFTKYSSMDVIKKSLSLGRQLTHQNTATYLSENESITSDHQAVIDMSISLQNIPDSLQFPNLVTSPYSNSDSDVSLLHKKHPIQVSPTTNVNTTVTQPSHSDAANPIHFKSASLLDTEEMCDYIHDVTLPRYHTITKGWHKSLIFY